MKYGLTLFLLSALAGSLALSQTTTTKKSPAPATKKAAAKAVSSAKKTTSSNSKKAASSKKAKSGKKPSVAAYRQLAPTPERYREIQQSLVDKGYLKSEPNGVWNDESAEALRQFQTDQKLSPTGKLSSASLIALGLGPKTDARTSPQPPGQPQALGSPPTAAPVPAPEN
jgi:Ni/Co efflux regulator RcnB